MELPMLFGRVIADPITNEDEDPPMPQPEAAAMTLEERYCALLAGKQSPGEWPPGTLAIFKVGFDPRREEFRSQPLMVIGSDVRSYRDAYRCDQFGRGDLVCMFLQLDGNVSIMLVDGRMIEPWPRQSDAEVAKVDPRGSLTDQVELGLPAAGVGALEGSS